MSVTIDDVRLRELYARIPAFECKAGCTDCCGPVPGSPSERGRVPGLLPAEDPATALATALATDECATCQHANGGCSVYSDRPFMCRLFGTAPADPRLRCPHGCAPEKPLTAAEAGVLTEQYLELALRESTA